MMKTSFSLSSLRGSNPSQAPPARPYNSLKKKRKQYDQDTWIRCLSGSMITTRDENKDDFWAALQSNYNFIMDNNLIDSCTEADSELANFTGEMCNFRDLATQFSELYSWLNSIQESVYSKDDNNVKKSLEEMDCRNSRREAFIDQATRLVQVYPEIKDEITWRINHLNSKWDAVKQAISLSDPQESQTDVEHEVRCLRKWMHEMESRLQPLSFRRDWTLQEVEGKALEHTVLQKDIESHGKIVSSVLKLCNKSISNESIDSTSSDHQQQQSQINKRSSNLRRAVLGLERRWHLLFLRSLEWQCHIETLHKRFLNSSAGELSVRCDSETDEEPVTKQPRLSSLVSSSPQYTNSYSSASSDNELSTSSESDGEFYFEDGIESTCVLVDTNIGQNINAKITNEMDLKQKQKRLETERKKRTKLSKPTPPDMCAPTTKIDYNGPNNVTYYCQHRDTDSGESADVQTMEQSSDDEWTFQTAKTVKTDDSLTCSTPQRSPNNPKLTKDQLHRLVQKAEKLVSTPAKVRKPIIEPIKYKRVKEWLNRSAPADIFDTKMKGDDPCDASGEYTTGESDIDKESQSSEDLNESIATFRQVGGCTSQATSTEVIAEIDSTQIPHTNDLIPKSLSNLETYTSKVNLRTKRSGNKSNRPWSVACISSLQNNRKLVSQSLIDPQSNNTGLNSFSISESALHELQSLSNRNRLTSNSINSIGTLNSPDSPAKNNRKKIRARKYTTSGSGRKSESGSDAPIRSLFKSGSFSGAAAAKHNAIAERNISSEPIAQVFDSDVELTPQQYNQTTMKCNNTVNGGLKQLPEFKVGAQVLNPIKLSVPERDSSPEKNSLNTVGTEEHLSSLSEWDNYFEKYTSEPYSETPDSEAARRLLEFGEDYRNYIDSQSDCCSSLSARTQSQSPAFQRRHYRPNGTTPSPPSTQNISDNSSATLGQHNNSQTILDSESDVEEYRHVIRESRAQLYYTEGVFTKQLSSLDTKSDTLQYDFSDIIATCRENLYYLQVLLKVHEKVATLSEIRDIRALHTSWSTMQAQAVELQRGKSLDCQITDMRAEFIALAVQTNIKTVQSRQELARLMDHVKIELKILQDRKSILLNLNVAVHKFLTDPAVIKLSGGGTVAFNSDSNQMQNKAMTVCAAHLKDRIADLYRLWNETYDNITEHLNNLQGLHNLWSQLEMRLDELEGVLRSDECTLRMLDTALQDGTVSADVATSVRDVAKVLSEKQNKRDNGNTTDRSNNNQPSQLIDVSGSLSDSGISDEGSEQELSERERRLAVLRRLVRQLGNVLAPGSEALTLMSQRIEQNEIELRDLQRTCRALIVRTAVCAEVRAQKQDASTTTVNLPPMTSVFSKRRIRGKLTMKQIHFRNNPNDPDGDDPNHKPWLWRVMRASLPFQLALVALFCVACLLEPHCCDRINNLSMSLTPQLRYIKGPPPV